MITLRQLRYLAALAQHREVTSAVLPANGTGNQSTGQSGAYLDLHTTLTTTSTFPFRIIGLVVDPPGANGTDLATPYAELMVMWNNEFYRQLTGI